MKLLVLVGLFVVAILAEKAFAHHEEHDDDSHPCAQGLYVPKKDEPRCMALIQRWYHNHATGQCEPFDYDGCSKNDNHFKTKAECDETCGAWHEAHKDHHHGHGHHHHAHGHSHGHDHGKSHDHSNCNHEKHEGHSHESHEGHDHHD